jgi:hypothetical protein
MARRAKPSVPGQLALFEPGAKRRRQRYIPAYDHHPAETIRHANEVLDRLVGRRRGLKPYEGRCPGCGKVISIKAPDCGRRWCPAVFPKWSRDQRRVTAEALREYGESMADAGSIPAASTSGHEFAATIICTASSR